MPAGNPSTLVSPKKGEIRNPHGHNGRHYNTFKGLISEVQKQYAGALEMEHKVYGKISNPHHLAAMMLFAAMMAGEEWAIREWLAHSIGKPHQPIELTGADGGPIQITPAHLQSAKDKLDALMLAQGGTNGNGDGHGTNGKNVSGSNGSGRNVKRVKED